MFGRRVLCPCWLVCRVGQSIFAGLRFPVRGPVLCSRAVFRAVFRAVLRLLVQTCAHARVPSAQSGHWCSTSRTGTDTSMNARTIVQVFTAVCGLLWCYGRCAYAWGYSAGGSCVPVRRCACGLCRLAPYSLSSLRCAECDSRVVQPLASATATVLAYSGLRSSALCSRPSASRSSS